MARRKCKGPNGEPGWQVLMANGESSECFWWVAGDSMSTLRALAAVQAAEAPDPVNDDQTRALTGPSS